uniref:Ig-like domain-containing protein n=1 Tax=Poecilia mexicana TaxID=48701 RepID=A0A3B3XQJ1_9TELE
MKEEYTVNWRQEKSTGQRLIAQWKNFKTTIVAYQDVLQLDLKNGSLTFIGIRREHSGLYRRYYNITVYGKFPVRQGSPKWVLEARHPASSPSDKSCYVACSVKSGPDVNLTWFNGPTIISSVNNSMHISMTLSLPLEIQPENKESFTCDARNPVTISHLHSFTDPCDMWKYAAVGLGGILIGIGIAILFIKYGRNPSCMVCEHIYCIIFKCKQKF